MMCVVLFPARTMALVWACTTNRIISATVSQVWFPKEVDHKECCVCVCVCTFILCFFSRLAACCESFSSACL
jgi:hypothetical protein